MSKQRDVRLNEKNKSVANCVARCSRNGPTEDDWSRLRGTENQQVTEKLFNYESAALPLSYLGP
jgi:hypothetical protein